MALQSCIERLGRIRGYAVDDLITADAIAARENVSPRTVYRDVQRLRQIGVKIEGERGVGYRIRAEKRRG